MEWLLEQDVLGMLLCLMGKRPSLADALDLPETAALEGPLRDRAVQLGLLHEEGEQLSVNPGLQSALELAFSTSSVVRVSGRRGESEPVQRYLYPAEPSTLVVDKMPGHLRVRCTSRAEAVHEVVDLLALGDSPPDASDVVVMFRPPDTASAADSASQAAKLFDIVNRGDIWCIERVSESAPGSMLLLVNCGTEGWALCPSGEDKLILKPVSAVAMEVVVNRMFEEAQQESLRV